MIFYDFYYNKKKINKFKWFRVQHITYIKDYIQSIFSQFKSLSNTLEFAYFIVFIY
jgi:hypothetical protein